MALDGLGYLGFVVEALRLLVQGLLLAGDSSRPCVRFANQLARRVCYLLEMNFRMGVEYVIEQPSTSLLFTYKCIRDP